MRKIFLSAMAIAISALVLTGCSKNSDPYVPPTPEKTDVEKYNEKFRSYVGGTIASDQDWGFDASQVAGVRGLTRGSETGYFVTDEYPKDYTKSFYDQALDSLPEKRKDPGNYIKNFEFKSRGPVRFNLVFAFTVSEMEVGYYYYNPATETYKDKKEVVLLSNFTSDFKSNKYLQYTDKSGPSAKDWIDYNPAQGAYIWEYYHAKKVRAKMFTLRDGSEDPAIIDVPVGYHIGFYTKIGDKKYYTNRYLNENEGNTNFVVINSKDADLENTYLVGIEDLDPQDSDFDCNDVMIDVHKNIETTFAELIIPQKAIETYRIIGEDLTVEDINADFDFNDIVLDVTLTATGADCELQAAGGQLPIRINGQDDLEVHKLFGVDEKVMVNTNAEKIGLRGVSKPSCKFSISGKRFSSVKDVMIEVKKNEVWIPFFANKGETACKILVKDTSFKWPDERESLKGKYPKFIQWVQNNDIDVWWK